MLIVPLYLTLTHSEWWKAPLASIAIAAVSGWTRPGRGLASVGLRMARAHIGLSLPLCGAVAAVSLAGIQFVARRSGVEYLPFLEKQEAGPFLVHALSQTLNEEMVLGALLLGYARRTFRAVHPVVIALSRGAVVSMLHRLFYELRPPHDPVYGKLSAKALLSLFFVGVLRNNLIVGTGHIGCAWALHAGWNVVLLSGGRDVATGEFPAEPALFNCVPGNPLLLLATSTLMILSVLSYTRRGTEPATRGGAAG